MVVETRLYEQLGLQPDASPEDIRRSYRQAALRWHPDRNQGDADAAENFKACLQAYEILSEPRTRATYDALGLGGVLRSAAPADAAETAESRGNEHATSSSTAGPGHADYDDIYRDRDQSRYHYNSSRHHHGHGRAYERDFFPFPDDDPMSAFHSFFSSSHTTVPDERSHYRSHYRDRDHDRGRSQAQTQTQTQTQDGDPQAFRYQSSWSFQMGDGDGQGRGTYTTHVHTWNSRDGHRSVSHHGRLGDGHDGRAFTTISSNSREPFAALGQFPSLFGSWGQGFGFPAGGPFGSEHVRNSNTSLLDGHGDHSLAGDPFGLFSGFFGQEFGPRRRNTTFWM